MAETATTTEKAAETKTETATEKAAETKTAETAKTETAAAETKADAAAETKTEAAAKTEEKSEVKTEAAKNSATETKDKKAEAEKPAEIVLKVPEKTLLGKDDIERVKKISQEKNLTPEQAQALLDDENQAVSAYADRQKAQLDTEVESWKDKSKNDKEIGGEAFAKNVELAKRVVDRFASKEMIEALNKSGLGNHPELVRCFVRIGKQMSDDELKLGSFSSGTQEKSKADRMFPTTANKGES